jgi:cobalt/nickel transport system permease protein
MHHALETYAATNRLRDVDPAQKLGFALGLLLLSLGLNPLTQLLVTLWLAMWIVGYAKIPARVYLQVLALAMVFMLTSSLALVLNWVPQEQWGVMTTDRLWAWPILGGYGLVSRSGLVQAGTIAARSLAGTSCLLLIIFTTPITELLQTLRQMRVPEVLLELMLLMYRFIMLFWEVIFDLQLAQQARCGYRTRRRWLVSVSLIVSQLLLRVLRYYQDFTLALQARGFNGHFRLYSDRSYYFSRRYALEAIGGCLLLLSINGQL